jgi:hypothetical protein
VNRGLSRKKSDSKNHETYANDVFYTMYKKIMKDVREPPKYEKADSTDTDYTKVKNIYKDLLFFVDKPEDSCDFDLVYALYKKYYSKFSAISDIVKKQLFTKKKLSHNRRNTRGGNRKKRMSKKGGECLDCMKGIYLILGYASFITMIVCGALSHGDMNSTYGHVFVYIWITYASILGAAIVAGISSACFGQQCAQFLNGIDTFILERCGYLSGVCQGIREGLYTNVQGLHTAIREAEIQTATEVLQPADPQALVEMRIVHANVHHISRQGIINVLPIDPVNVEPDPVNQTYGRFLCYIYWGCKRDIEVLATPVEIQTV